MKKCIKKLVLLFGVPALFMSVSTVAVSASEPLLSEDKSWTCAKVYRNFSSPGYNEKHVTTYSVVKSVVVDGKDCFEVSAVRNDDGAVLDNYVLYESEGKLFLMYDDGDGSWLMLPILDFSFEKGDIVERHDLMDYLLPDHSSGYETFVVEEALEVKVNGTARKELVLEYSALGEVATCWVEGVGASANYYLTEFGRTSDGYVHTKMIACYQDGECIFLQEDFAYQVAAIEEVEAEPAGSGRIFDLRGVEVREPRAGSIYIRGGSKFIVR